MGTGHDEWITLTTEHPIDPDLPICDSHHHLWDRPNDRYLLDEFLQDANGGHNITETVFVEGSSSMYRKDGPQEMRPVGETEFIAQLTEITQSGKTKVAAGIVGFADLTLGSAVVPVFEAHIAAGAKRFRGIRHMSIWDASPEIRPTDPGAGNFKGLLLDPNFRQGFACLHKYHLSFDAWLYHTQLAELADLAKTFQQTTIILNHIGGPLGSGPYAGKRAEVFQEWKRGMAVLAKYPNVFVKLGGLGIRRFGLGWYDRALPPSSAEVAETLAPYYGWCIDQFGVNRCMFESNFPPDKVSYSYTVMWNAFKRIVAGASREDKNALLHDTAVKVYRLTMNPEEKWWEMRKLS